MVCCCDNNRSFRHTKYLLDFYKVIAYIKEIGRKEFIMKRFNNSNEETPWGWYIFRALLFLNVVGGLMILPYIF